MSAWPGFAGVGWPWRRRRAEHAPGEEEAKANLRSLRTLLLLGVLVPLLLFASFAGYRWQQLQAETELRLDRTLRIAIEHALKVLETNEALLDHVLALGAVDDEALLRERAPQLQAQLARLAAPKPQVHEIWLMDAQGLAVASSRAQPAPAVGGRAADAHYEFHRARPAGLPYFSPVSAGSLPGEAYFSMSRSRQRADTSLGGIASVALRTEYFTRFHADLSADEPGLAITMFRDDGVVYSRWPRLSSAPSRMAAGSPVLRRVQAGERRGSVRGVSSLDRNARLILFQRVGDYPVYLGTGTELRSMQDTWLREMALIVAFSVLPVLGLVIAALIAMKRARQTLAAAQRLREEAEARLQVEEALRQAQKMEAMGRLTGGVAHDFNNALMVISANLHVLKMLQPQVAGKQTDAIGRAVETAANLTRQLLAFSRRQALMPRVVRLQDQLPQLRDLLAPVLGSQVPLAIDVEPGTAPIKVDLAELELALINLAVNAKDAMPGGGSFRVRAGDAPLPPPLSGPGVRIEAVDSGSGIPPDLLARVFEPFFTTKPVGEGTGLGLSQVYGLCERSGGVARLHSIEGRGTTVSLYFPAVAHQATPETADDDGSPPRLDLRLLLVEDNPEVASAIRPVLESLGCVVHHYARAELAAQWLKDHHVEVDTVLTDVVMPGAMDGLGLAQHVRRTHPQLGLVVMTGYSEQMQEIQRQGFTLLAKPWNVANLARALRTARPPGAG